MSELRCILYQAFHYPLVAYHVLRLILLEEDVRLAVVDVMVDDTQALGRRDEAKGRDLIQEKPLVITRIRAGVVHQDAEAQPPGIRYLIDAQLTITLPCALCLIDGNQAILLQLRQQGIQPSIADTRIRPDHVINDLGDQITMRRAMHQLRQNDKLIHLSLSTFQKNAQAVSCRISL